MTRLFDEATGTRADVRAEPPAPSLFPVRLSNTHCAKRSPCRASPGVRRHRTATCAGRGGLEGRARRRAGGSSWESHPGRTTLQRRTGPRARTRTGSRSSPRSLETHRPIDIRRDNAQVHQTTVKGALCAGRRMDIALSVGEGARFAVRASPPGPTARTPADRDRRRRFVPDPGEAAASRRSRQRLGEKSRAPRPRPARTFAARSAAPSVEPHGARRLRSTRRLASHLDADAHVATPTDPRRRARGLLLGADLDIARRTAARLLSDTDGAGE